MPVGGFLTNSFFKKAGLFAILAGAGGCNFFDGDAVNTAEENGDAVNTSAESKDFVYLNDYRPSEFTTDDVYLNLDIREDHTLVTSSVTYTRTAYGAGSGRLVLDAENPNKTGKYILSVKLDGQELTEGQGYIYNEKAEQVLIDASPDLQEVPVEITTRLAPHLSKKYKDWTGLYRSDDLLITQNESEGFRRITPMLDRPDIQARYRVRIEASKDDYPVLLAGGEQVSTESLPNNRHAVTYYDPVPKPSYLFATANGKLGVLEDTYTTQSGRDIVLRIYAEEEKVRRGRFALDTLKEIMAWHENTFQVEYDRDSYNIVSARYFSGAMENTGLNIFQEEFILTRPGGSSNSEHYKIAEILAHEFVHHRSGNHVTIRDFFNTTVKEGLTTNRAQMFMAHFLSEPYERVGTVYTVDWLLENGGFSPALIPQQVESWNEVYAVAYSKGSEVYRMMRLLMGDEQFIAGQRHYFEKHQGEAVTIKELVQAMEEVSGLDFSGQFMRWFTQPGQVEVAVESKYDPAAKTYTLSLKQSNSAGSPPFYVPVAVELVDKQGGNMKLVLDSDDVSDPERGARERLLLLTESEQSFVFVDVAEEPAFHSVFDNMSAPVIVQDNLSTDQIYRKYLDDEDMFDRMWAGMTLKEQEIKRLKANYVKGSVPEVDPRLIEAFRTIAQDPAIAPAIKNIMIKLPFFYTEDSEEKAINAAIEGAVGRALYDEFTTLYEKNKTDGKVEYRYDLFGKKNLAGRAESYLKAADALPAQPKQAPQPALTQ